MKILVAEPLAQDGIDILKEHYEVDVRPSLSPEELRDIIAGYEAIIVRSQTKVSADIIEAGKKLLVIGRAGVGIDNIDVAAASQRGIVVVNSPTGNTISAAEHTTALMLALARHIPQANASLKLGKWLRNQFMGTEVRGKTMGLIGLGNVGSEVAKRAKGLEMKVIAYDPYISLERAQNLQVELESLDVVLSTADFVSLHVPLTEQTKGLIGKRALSLMKPTARLINTARGQLIDEEALADAIRNGKLAGAAIDVFANEPCTSSILFGLDNIIVTPHLGASTQEAQTLAATEVARQVIDTLQGKPARYAVNAPFISPEVMPVIGPFLKVAYIIGSLASQLAEGQVRKLTITYNGEIAEHDTSSLKAALLGGLLKNICEERVNLVNANIVASKRGITITEQKEPAMDNYSNLITAEAQTAAGPTTVAGTLIRSEIHIVQVNNYWIDITPSGSYFLFSDHLDRPGLIGTVGQIIGEADINISYMHLSRLKPRGQALMVLALDEPLPQETLERILKIPNIYTAKLVHL